MNETEKEIVAWLKEMATSPALVPLETYRVMFIADAIFHGEHRQHSPATVKDS